MKIHSLVSALKSFVLSLLACLGLASMAFAQAQPNYQGQIQSGFDRGFTTSAEFTGSSNSLGRFFELNSSVGYNLSNHFGVDLGMPLYFVQPSGSTTNSGIGNAYLDVRLKFANPVVNWGSVLTGYAPTGDSAKGLSTGRATFDWTNRFDRRFSSLTPFVEAGLADTIPDSQLFTRPYTTLGFNTHFRGGASLDVWKFFSVGAAAYDIVASGQQKVFSRLVASGGAGAISTSGHGRVFEAGHETVGPASIGSDDGYSGWVDVNPMSYLSFELGYTHSIPYALNTVSFGVGFNLGSLAHKKSQP